MFVSTFSIPESFRRILSPVFFSKKTKWVPAAVVALFLGAGGSFSYAQTFLDADSAAADSLVLLVPSPDDSLLSDEFVPDTVLSDTAVSDTAVSYRVPREHRGELVKQVSAFVVRHASGAALMQGPHSNLTRELYHDLGRTALLRFDESGFQRTRSFKIFPFRYFGTTALFPAAQPKLYRGIRMNYDYTHSFLQGYKYITFTDTATGYYIFKEQIGKRQRNWKNITVIGKRDFMNLRQKSVTRQEIQKSVKKELGRKETQRGGFRIFSTKVPANETFLKIFGGDEVSLEVNGNINVRTAIRNEKRSNKASTLSGQSTTSLKVEQMQQFTVKGKVGEKVEIYIDQDSERLFDFENNIRVIYTGYDDEIIQKIEAGNINLSLPGTRLISVNQNNKGLFGIKSLMRIGDLELTTIASVQRGEKDVRTFKGNAAETEIEIKDFNYIKNQYFFLDSLFRDNYESYDAGTGTRDISAVAQKAIKDIRVYRFSQGNTTNPDAIDAIAYPDLDNPAEDQKQTGKFIELRQGQEFTVNPNEGSIYLLAPLQDDDALAVAYVTQDNQIVGTFTLDSTATDIQLKLIKAKNQKATDPTWDLELKNVYFLGATNVPTGQGFELEILYVQSGAVPSSTLPSGQRLISALGLDEQNNQNASDRTPDGLVDVENFTIINPSRGLLTFPYLEPFAFDDQTNLAYYGKKDIPAEIPVPGGTAISLDRSAIYTYDRTSQNTEINAERFRIFVKFKKPSSQYNLGAINILEGSEEVFLDGNKMTKDIDYTIDYFSGDVVLIGKDLTSESDIKINFEKAQLFQIDKKSLFGSRAEYRFTDRSFVGLTALFHSQSTIEQRIQVGEEPFRNFIWDANTLIDFDFELLTKIADKVPLVNALDQSKVTFEAEYAQVLPAANTSSGAVKKDEGGVAYVDDFEASKRTFSLGINRRSWALSSTPVGMDPKKRGKLVWFDVPNVQRDDVFTIAGKSNSKDVINLLHFSFLAKDGVKPDESWGGIMHVLPPSQLTDSRFIEIWVLGNAGRINIDLGEISEDVNGNNFINTEQTGTVDAGIGEEDDVGLDSLDNQAERTVLQNLGPNPPQSVRDSLQALFPWGIISFDNPEVEDPFGDDWVNFATSNDVVQLVRRLDGDSTVAALKINGVEKNGSDGVSRIADTEDINRTGPDLDLINSYRTYSFSLNPNDMTSQEYLAGIGQPDRNFPGDPGVVWRLFRLPLDAPTDSVGNPTNIEFIRLWIQPDPNDTVTLIDVAEFNLVGSDWIFPPNTSGVFLDPDGKVVPAGDLDNVVEIATINTEEQGNIYDPHPKIRVRNVKEGTGQSTERKEREQALLVRLNELPPGATALIQKSLLPAQNYINYQKFRAFVHGDELVNSQLPDSSEGQSPIEVFIRFQTVDNNNYYEIARPLYKGWLQNDIEVNFSELTALKADDSVIPDSVTLVKSRLLEDGKTVRVRGNPSITNINRLFIGVRNLNPRLAYSGDIWFNEFRVTNINNDKGSAARVSLNFNFSDLASVGGSFEFRSENFHTLEQRVNAALTESKNFTFNSTLNTHKFLLEKWGIKTPFNFVYARNQANSKYLPGNDILVSSVEAQRAVLKAELELINEELDRQIFVGEDTTATARDLREKDSLKTILDNRIARAESFSERTSYSVSFNKTTSKKKRSTWLEHILFYTSRVTLDAMSITASLDNTSNRNAANEFDDNRNIKGNITYNVPIPRHKKIKPLTGVLQAKILGVKIEKIPLVRSLFGWELDYLPSAITTNFGLTNDRREKKTRPSVGGVTQKEVTKSYTGTRGITANWTMFRSLGMSFSRNYQMDLQGLKPGDIFGGIFNSFDYSNPLLILEDSLLNSADSTFKKDTDRDYAIVQNFNLNFNPQLVNWVSNSFTYGANHRWTKNRTQNDEFRQGSALARSMSLQLGLNLQTWSAWLRKKAGAAPGVGRPGGGRGKRGKLPKTGEKEGTDDKKSPGPPRISTETFKNAVLKGAAKIIDLAGNIKTEYRFEDDVTANPLNFEPDLEHRLGLSDIKKSARVDWNELADEGTLLNYGYQIRSMRSWNINTNISPFSFLNVGIRFDTAQTVTETFTDKGLADNAVNKTIVRSRSFFLVSDDITKDDVDDGLAFPDINVSVSGVERFPLIDVTLGKVANTVTYSFNYTGQRKETVTGTESIGLDSTGAEIELRTFNPPELNFTRNYQPLVGLNFGWKKGFNSDFTWSKGVSIGTTNQGNTRNKTITSNMSVTGSYSRRGGFRIPFWFLRNKKLDNQIRFSLTFVLSSSKSFKFITGSESEEEVINSNRRFAIEPSATYSFTSRITGGFRLKFEQITDRHTGKTRNIEGGIEVNVSIGN